jgi:galactokinase
VTGDAIAAALVREGLPIDQAAAKAALFDRVLAALDGAAACAWWVPGRLEVFGKHTDYAGGRSLVCAVPRGIAFAARPRGDGLVTAFDAASNARFSSDAGAAAGWQRYIATVLHRLALNFPETDGGADIVFASDLPRASGMSSSSALLVGTAEALVRRRRIDRTARWNEAVTGPLAASAYYACIENGASFGPLAGDAGVGTHGGSEDHAAILTARPGELSAFAFVPLRLLDRAPLPEAWSFVIAPSGARSEKTGGAQDRYNRLSAAVSALLAAWNARETPADSLAAALASRPGAAAALDRLIGDAAPAGWTAAELRARLEHFTREDARVPLALDAFAAADAPMLSSLAASSQRDADLLLGNQVDETRALAAAAVSRGAIGAASFGAGFGGSVWALVPRERAESFARDWHPAAFPVRPGPPLTRFTEETLRAA